MRKYSFACFVLLCLTPRLWADVVPVVFFNETFGTPSDYVAVANYAGWSEQGVSYSGSASVSPIYCSVAGSSGQGGMSLSGSNEYLQVSGINTSAYGDISLSLNCRMSERNAAAIYYSTDGGQTWQSFLVSYTGSNADKWFTFTCSGLPSVENLTLKIQPYNNFKLSFDDLKLQAAYRSTTLVAHNSEGHWATYSRDADVFIQGDAAVYTLGLNGAELQMNLIPQTTETINSQSVTGTLVPANTGVLLHTSSEVTGVKVWQWSGSTISTMEGNLLHPGTGALCAEQNCKFYKLAYNDYSAQTDLGFYYAQEGGAAYACQKGLAYLAVPATLAPPRFVFPISASTSLAGMRGIAEDGKRLQNGRLYIRHQGAVFNVAGQRIK